MQTWFTNIMRLRYCMLLFGSLLLNTQLHAELNTNSISVNVLEHELDVLQFPADGTHLLLWVTPGYGTHERAYQLAQKLSARGLEVWHIDLAESLFLPKSTSTLRAMDGRYVAGLVSAAHSRTGKTVVLMTRASGALPVLRGARIWQQQFYANKNHPDPYLAGAVLFAPELYSSTPELGLPPVYDPIARATNIPIMLYQAGKRGNRWQLDATMEQLETGGAKIMLKVLPGVTGVFYNEDNAPETHKVLKSLVSELPRVIRVLDGMTMPPPVAVLADASPGEPGGLDITLKPFKGKPQPAALDLKNSLGEQFKRDDYRGKVTLINFWASWCTPCVEEIPSLNHLREKMQGRAFELISVNYAEDEQRIRDFMQMVKVDFPVLLDSDGRVAAAWNVLVFPATFVIGAEGKIEYGVNGAIYWDSPEVVTQLEALLPSD